MRPRSLNFLLSSVFLFFFLLVTVLGLFSIERLSEFNRESADVRDIWLPSTRFIGDLNNFTSDFRAAEGRDLLSSTSLESAASRKEIADLGRAVVQAQSGYEGLRHSPDISSLYAQFKQKWMEYRVVADNVLELDAAGRTSEAIDLYRTTSQSTYDAASDALGQVTHLNIASASAASDQADAAYRNARAFIGIAIVYVTGRTVVDGLAAFGVGILLFLTGILLAAESRPLLVGKAVSPVQARTILQIVEKDARVRKVRGFQSMMLGPEDILVALRVNFQDGLNTDEIEAAIDQVSLALRQSFPAIRHLVIEPES